jgi:hypothetical protein
VKNHRQVTFTLDIGHRIIFGIHVNLRQVMVHVKISECFPIINEHTAPCLCYFTNLS